MKTKFLLFATVLCLFGLSSCQSDELSFDEEASFEENIIKRCEVCPAFPNQPLDDKIHINNGGLEVQFNEDLSYLSMNLWFYYFPNTIYELPDYAYILVEIVQVDCNNRSNVIEGGDIILSKNVLLNEDGSNLYFVEANVDSDPDKCYALRITTPEGSVYINWTAFL